MEYDASGGAGLILRRSVQLRAEIIDLNQAELYKGNEFYVEACADGGSEGSIRAEAEAAGDRCKGRTIAKRSKRILGFLGCAEQRVYERRDSCWQGELRANKKSVFTGPCAIQRAIRSVEGGHGSDERQKLVLASKLPAVEVCLGRGEGLNGTEV